MIGDVAGTRRGLPGGRRAAPVRDDARQFPALSAVPADGIHRTPIRSLGMLPVARDQEGTFCVPVAEDETFWLGASMEKTGGSFRLFAQMGDKHRLNVQSGRPAAADADSAFHFSGFGAIYGIPRDAESWWSFRRVAAEPMRACEWLIFAELGSLPSRKRLCKPASCLSATRYTHSGHTSRRLRHSIPAPATEGGCCLNDLEGRIYATALGDNWLGASCARAHAVVVRAKTILGSRLPARLSRYGADICAFDARLAGADLLLIASVAFVQIRFLEPVVRRGRRSKRRGSAASYS